MATTKVATSKFVSSGPATNATAVPGARISWAKPGAPGVKVFGATATNAGGAGKHHNGVATHGTYFITSANGATYTLVYLATGATAKQKAAAVANPLVNAAPKYGTAYNTAVNHSRTVVAAAIAKAAAPANAPATPAPVTAA